MLRPCRDASRAAAVEHGDPLRDEPRPTGRSPCSCSSGTGASFPGVHAFPGGIVDPTDASVAGASLPAAQAWAAPGEGDTPDDALPCWSRPSASSSRRWHPARRARRAARRARSTTGSWPCAPRPLRRAVRRAPRRARARAGDRRAPHFALDHAADEPSDSTRSSGGADGPGRDRGRHRDRRPRVAHAHGALPRLSRGRIQLMPPTSGPSTTSRASARPTRCSPTRAGACARALSEIDAGGAMPAMTYPDNTGSGLRRAASSCATAAGGL
jgi:hypothetical protein